jgi:hypothetical protein
MSGLETRTNRGLAFLVGLLLPVLTLQTRYVGTPVDWTSRVVPVDVLCAIFLAIFALRHPMRPLPWPAALYLAAVVFSLFPGLLVTPGPERDVWAQFLGLGMGFAFYVLGLNLGRSPGAVAALLAGTAAAVAAEAVIVYHDVLVPSSPWFPDPMPGRARGTFKANGQLGAYGFCAAGLLATFGAVAGSPGRRTLGVLTALLSASFVFPASRRTGMLCVFLWAAVFLALGVRFARKVPYRLLAAGFLAVGVGVAVYRAHLETSFVGRRVQAAVSGLRDRDNFVERQHRRTLATFEEWFPWGFGAGRGHWIDPRDGHEVHNGLLAVFVEQGILGFVGFAGMMLYPLFRSASGNASADGGVHGGGDEDAALFRAIASSFLLVSFVFIIHNTLYRDRTFLLYLGLVTSWEKR